MVTNGAGLTHDLLDQLSMRGLRSVAISIDADNVTARRDLGRALALLLAARQRGIIPVVNTIVSAQTNTRELRHFVRQALDAGVFVAPLVCSPRVPNGQFSAADSHLLPSQSQLRRLVWWLIWRKVMTGRVTTTFGALWRLRTVGRRDSRPDRNLWHCRENYASDGTSRGRGIISIDSDGSLGPCQEYPNLWSPSSPLPTELSVLDGVFASTIRSCPGCTFVCYMNEKSLDGIIALAEIPTALAWSRIPANHSQARRPISK